MTLNRLKWNFTNDWWFNDCYQTDALFSQICAHWGHSAAHHNLIRHVAEGIPGH